MSTHFSKVWMSPVGPLLFVSDETHIQALVFNHAGDFLRKQLGIESLIDCSTKVIDQAICELTEYFEGQRKTFSVPYRLEGTDFQKKVWKTLEKIPYGEVWSYKTQANAFGDLNAIRAVASANGRNPISIIVPCHRVIGKSGTLTGYGGGVDIKARLLEIEGYSIQQKEKASESPSTFVSNHTKVIRLETQKQTT
jgi:methylated-DNA-[protein]-cysteine S-methyltransferase